MRTSVLLLLSLSPTLVGCSSPPAGEVPEERLTSVYRIGAGERLSGLIQADEIWLPGGTSVEVTGDLRLVARTRIEIEGVLRVVDANDSGRDPLDAPTVRLEAGERVSVDGEILGGDGHASGSGTTIVILAPEQFVSGRIQAGDGGDARGGGNGGPGGDIWVVGNLPEQAMRVGLPRNTSGLFGGNGGFPDGSGGSARVLAWEQRDNLPADL